MVKTDVPHVDFRGAVHELYAVWLKVATSVERNQ